MTRVETDVPLLPLLALGAQMERLREQLREALISHSDARVQSVADDLPDLHVDDAINIVVLGQHDAGKSLLVRCLTGRRDIGVGAGPLTDRSTAYDWSGHRLVDTPGVESGRTEHDAIAEQALRAADVVVFVLTVEGLDDVIAQYYLRVRRQLRSIRGLVIVVNKALSERSDRAVSEADIAQAIGPSYDLVPVVWTDARRWDEAAEALDPELARTESGLPVLADTITDLVRGQGATVRLLSPLRGWSDAAQQALALLSTDESGRAELSELDALASDLEHQRQTAMDDVRDRADEAIVRLVADLRSAGPHLEQTDFERLVQKAADVFDDRVAEDGARRDAAVVARHATPAQQRLDVPQVDVRRLLQESLSKVSRTFSGTGVRPGGAGHRWVLETWHSVGGKFKPHGAVNASKTIGRLATRANQAISAGAVALEIYNHYRDAQVQADRAAAVAAWRGESVHIADEVVAHWRTDAELAVEELHQVRADDVARRRLTVLLRVTDADESAQRLLDLDQQCHQLIDELAAHPSTA